MMKLYFRKAKIIWYKIQIHVTTSICCHSEHIPSLLHNHPINIQKRLDERLAFRSYYKQWFQAAHFFKQNVKLTYCKREVELLFLELNTIEVQEMLRKLKF